MRIKRNLKSVFDSSIICLAVLAGVLSGLPAEQADAYDSAGIKLKAGAVYRISEADSAVVGVSEGTKVSSLLKSFEGVLGVLGSGGSRLASGDVVCTGARLSGKGRILEVSVLGDLDGDGRVSTQDCRILREYFVNERELRAARFLAADSDRDLELTTADYIRIIRHLGGTADLSDVFATAEEIQPEYSGGIGKIKSRELVKDITLGWNYAFGISSYDDFGKILDGLADGGINTIKFPATWFEKNSRYYYGTGSGDYFEHIKKMVDMAYERGFYVVLGFYDSVEFALTFENEARVLEKTEQLYSQLCDRFKDYDEHLLFEYLNEPRNAGSSTPYVPTAQGLEVLNNVTRKFVETVRASGGNNLYRHLIVSTYCGATTEICLSSFEVPEDERVIAAVHLYRPVDLVHEKNDISSWSDKENEYKKSIFDSFTAVKERFIDKNIPVLVTEFASRDKQNTQERVKWLKYYLSVTEAYGMKCFWWDTGVKANEGAYTFSIFDRSTFKWFFPELLRTIQDVLSGRDYIPIYELPFGTKLSIGDKFALPDKLRDYRTGEYVPAEWDYSEGYLEKRGDAFYAVRAGVLKLNCRVNGHSESYEISVLPLEDLRSDFSLNYTVSDGKRQFLLGKDAPHYSRLEYYWYSSDAAVAGVSEYSTLTPICDGRVFIIAIHKETGALGITEIVVEGGEVISVGGKAVA